MLGLSRSEHKVTRALPVLLLTGAGLIFFLDSLWTLQGHPRVLCGNLAPPGDQSSSLINQVCSSSNTRKFNKVYQLYGKSTEVDVTSAIEKPYNSAKASPVHLFTIVMFLITPILTGDTILRIADTALDSSSSNENTSSACGTKARKVLCFVDRLTYVAAYFVTLSRIQEFMELRFDVRPSNILRILTGDFKSLLILNEQPGVATCDYSYKRLGKITRSNLPCVILYGPQIKLAYIFQIISWIIVAFVLIWIILGTFESILMLIFSSTSHCTDPSNVRESTVTERADNCRDSQQQGPDGEQTAPVTNQEIGFSS